MSQGPFDLQHPISPDGNYVWNGAQWVPNVRPAYRPLPWYKKSWGVPAVALILGASLAACGGGDAATTDDPPPAASSSAPEDDSSKPVVTLAALDRWWAANNDDQRKDNCIGFRFNEDTWWANLLEANQGKVMPRGLLTEFMTGRCTEDAKPIPVKSATPEPVESATPNPEIALSASIGDALGEVTRVDDDDSPMLTKVKWKESTGVLTVTYRLSDNLFGNGAIIGAGWDDIKDIMGAVEASGVPVQELRVNGTFEMQDKYGKSLGEQTVMATEWDEETLKNIEPDNLDDDGMRDLAAVIVIHPALQ